MIHDEELIAEIKRRFALNLYEAKVWLALLSKGISTAGEIADIANVPRSRSYDILESLRKKKFIRTKEGKPLRYIAIPPRDVIGGVKDYTEEKKKELMKKLEEIEKDEIVDELKNLYKQGAEQIAPPEESGAVRGRTNMRDHLDQMISQARQSIAILTTVQGLKFLNREHSHSLRIAMKNGVKIKIAAPITVENYMDAKELSEFCKLRHVDDIHARIYVIDGEEVMFMVVSEKEVHPAYDTGIWLRSQFFGKALADLFEHAYEFMEHGEKQIRKIEEEVKREDILKSGVHH